MRRTRTGSDCLRPEVTWRNEGRPWSQGGWERERPRGGKKPRWPGERGLRGPRLWAGKTPHAKARKPETGGEARKSGPSQPHPGYAQGGGRLPGEPAPDWRFGPFSPVPNHPGREGAGSRLDGRWPATYRLGRCNEASMKKIRTGSGGFRAGEHGGGEGAPRPTPTPGPVRLPHVAVPHLHPFVTTQSSHT